MMAIAKYYNILIGLVFIALGVVGVFLPEVVAELYGFIFQDNQSKTTLRAISGFSIGVGYLIVHFSLYVNHQKVVLLAIGILLLSFIIPRLVGLIVDGTHQPLMIKELVFELIMLIITVALYYREKVMSHP